MGSSFPGIEKKFVENRRGKIIVFPQIRYGKKIFENFDSFKVSDFWIGACLNGCVIIKNCVIFEHRLCCFPHVILNCLLTHGLFSLFSRYIFTIVSYLIGVFIFATIVGQVGNVITNRNANRLEFERLLDGAKTYMRHHKVSFYLVILRGDFKGRFCRVLSSSFVHNYSAV